MATQTMTRIGRWTWTPSDTFRADDEGTDPTIQDCAACDQPVMPGQPYMYCDQNGEIVHPAPRCPVLDFDRE